MKEDTMPATLRRSAPPASTTSASSASPAQRLQREFAAVRVAFTWFGVRKTLSSEQKAQAAEPFGAEGQFLSAAKKLFDTKHPKFQQLTSVRTRVVGYWKGLSLPYPEPGVRLLRQEEVGRFDDRMAEFHQELAEAVQALDEHYAQLKAAARERLGTLYGEADYPPTLLGLFDVEWSYPSVEPPEYLMRLNPHLYQQERERMAQRFDEAVRLAEEAFTTEFSKLVAHLTERLTAAPDGERKVFRDSAIGNLREFFERFRSLNVRSGADLDRLVEAAQQALAGVDPQAVRDSAGLRQQVSAQLASVQAALDRMLVDQPRRRVLRTKQGEVKA
jgi:hypothetical protein